MRRRLPLAAAMIAAVTAARLVSMTALQALAEDEVEFFRATAWIRRGLVPYRDFWEHHSPLQWFLFAPFAAGTHDAGVAAVVAMRWWQLPVWLLTFALLANIARRSGSSATAIALSVLLMIASPFFGHWAVQYRVDATACAFFVAALALWTSADESPFRAFLSGASLFSAGLANLRLGPLLVATVLLLPWTSKHRRRTTILFLAGIGAVAAIALTYALSTGSASAAFQDLWRENLRGDRDTSQQFSVLGVVAEALFGARGIDVAAILFAMGGAAGVVRALRARRSEALLAPVALVFVALPKAVYQYHFLIVFALLFPYVALELHRLLARRSTVVFVLAGVVTLLGVQSALLRGNEADLAYQDLIMKAADRAAPAGAPIFDGVGWALHRPPAYRYWFLPAMVRTLERERLLPPYDAPQMTANPPAAIITDNRALLWLQTHPQLGQYAARHYLPRWRNLWVASMSARLGPGASFDWVVPASGTYRIYASALLAMHPWFDQPLTVGGEDFALPVEVDLKGFAPASKLPLRFTLDGAAQPPADVLALRRGQRLHLDSAFPRPAGVIIAPVSETAFFRVPAPGVTLEGLYTMPHLPRLR